MAINNLTAKTGQTGWLIGPTADIWTVFNALIAVGYTCAVQGSPVAGNPSQQSYTINLSLQGYPLLTAVPGQWIVFDGQLAHVYTQAQVAALFNIT